MDNLQNKFYEGFTRLLLETIDSMGLERAQRLRAKNLTLLFRDSFKSADVRRATFPDEEPEKPEIADKIWASNGFCRASSIAFQVLMGGEEQGWHLYAIPDMFFPYGPHHYILHKPTNTVLDLTKDQFTHHSGLDNIPYHVGKPVYDKVVSNDSPANFAKALGIDLVAEAKKLKSTNIKNAKTRTGR